MQTSAETVVFKVKGDTLFEPDEKFTVVLTDPVNGAPGNDMRGEVTINDDDSTPTPTLSSPAVNEGNAGLVDLVFEATLNAPHPAVTFNYRTVAESANTTDYDAASGSKLFPANPSTAPNATTKVPITVKVKGDVLDELDETLKLELLNPTTDVVVRTATGTIRNDDNNSKLSINDALVGRAGNDDVHRDSLAGERARGQGELGDGERDGDGRRGLHRRQRHSHLRGRRADEDARGRCPRRREHRGERDAQGQPLQSGGIPAGNVLDGQGDGTIVDRNAPPSLSISDVLTREGVGAELHGHARRHDAADGHSRLQHRRRDGEGWARTTPRASGRSRSRPARRRRRSR